MSMHDVFEAIRAERAAQDAKFGPMNPLVRDEDPIKLAVLMEEVGEVAKAILEDSADGPDLKLELTQVAAVAVAWLEVLDAHAEHARTVGQLKVFCHGCLQEVDEVNGENRCRTCATTPAVEVTEACTSPDGCSNEECPYCNPEEPRPGLTPSA